MIKRICLKVCALFFAVFVVIGAYAFESVDAALGVSAASSEYKMTESYKSGSFYKNLCALSLSGDDARDVIAIALSQVGYHEGDSNSDFHGESKKGSRDFVEYNVLYGRLDNNQGNGLSYGYYWCASFVNWCFRQAGISEKATAGAEVSCQRWFSDCKEAGIYRSKNGYVPQTGDMIFFKDKGSAVDSTHVGLVRYSDGKNVYTVEGNTSNGNEYSSNGEYVALKEYALSNGYIAGYAAPKYNECRTSRRVDYSGGFLSAGEYISCEEIALFSDSALQSEKKQSIAPFSVFKVTVVSETYLKVSVDGASGYISRDGDFVQVMSGENVYVISYIDSDGSQLYKPQYRLAGESKNAYTNEPTRYGSGFAGWRLLSDPDTVVAPGGKLPDHDGDMMLEAVWDENRYTVRFEGADGTLIFETSGYYGTEYEIPTPPAPPAEHVFFGWGQETVGVIRGNATYTAQYIHEDELEAAISQNGSDKSAGCSSATGGAAVSIIAALCAAAFVFSKKNNKNPLE